VDGNFSLRHRVQTGSGAPPSLLLKGSGGALTGGRSAGGVKLTTHLHLVPRLRIHAVIPPSPQYVFMAWCLVKHRDDFTFSMPLLKNIFHWLRAFPSSHKRTVHNQNVGNDQSIITSCHAKVSSFTYCHLHCTTTLKPCVRLMR
jgi:hypothetical protein